MAKCLKTLDLWYTTLHLLSGIRTSPKQLPLVGGSTVGTSLEHMDKSLRVPLYSSTVVLALDYVAMT